MSEILLLLTLGRFAMAQVLPPPEALHTVLVYRDATYLYLAPGETPADNAGQGLVAVWAWTGIRPPQRLALESPADLEDLSAEALEPAGAFREVRLVVPRPPGAQRGAKPPPTPPGFHLVAAPADAWGQVPESFLPTWPVPSDGRVELPADRDRAWRLRLVGPGRGSWWIEVPSGEAPILVAPRPAYDISLRVVDAKGRPLPNATLYWMEAFSDKTSNGRILARSLSDPTGTVFLPALPDAAETSLVAMAAGKVPAVHRGRPGSLPEVLRLHDGLEVRGMVTDERGRALEGVRILGRSWILEGAGWPLTQRTATGADGTWSLSDLPRGPLVLTATKDGLAPHREEIHLDAASLDLPPWALRPGVALRIRVVDDLGDPVAGATVTAGHEIWKTSTGPRGLATLESLPADRAVELRVAADRHLGEHLDVPLPLPEELVVSLTRAFRLNGRFTTSREEPVSGGAATLRNGSEVRAWPLDPGGAFEIPMRPGRRGELLLTSPETAELRVPLPAGAPGEELDLGILRAPQALRVTGRVVSEDDGSPVAGARVWSLRASERGAAFAWMTDDVLSAISDGEGVFEVQGLPVLRGSLRIDAPGYARRLVLFEPPGGDSAGDEKDVVDVGAITLETGTILIVRAEREMSSQALARADLQGDWQEADFLSASFQGDRAVLGPIPSGTATLTVWDGRDLLCEREIQVRAGREELEVECEGADLQVVGTVRVGGEPAGPGMLVWEMPREDATPAVIQTTRGPGGLSRQQVLGGGRPPVRVAVGADGSFVSDRLRAGAWEVSWQTEGDGIAPPQIAAPRTVRLGAESPARVALDFPASRLSGVVVDADGAPVPDARVYEIGGGGFAWADADGRFELAGLQPGRLRLQARAGDRSSDVFEAELTPDRPPEPVRLTLESDRGKRFRLHVLDQVGRTVAGAFVFLEPEGEGLRMLTTRSDGTAEVNLDTSGAPRIRVAAFGDGVWALGDWISPDTAQQDGGAVLQLPEPGSLLVSSGQHRGTVPLRSEAGWSLDRLLLRLGQRPSAGPDTPLLVSGLPPGRYFVGSRDGAVHTATVRAGEVADVEMD